MKPQTQMAIISSSTTLAMYSMCRVLMRKGLITPQELVTSLQEDADAIVKNGGEAAALCSAIQHSLIEMIKKGTGVQTKGPVN